MANETTQAGGWEQVTPPVVVTPPTGDVGNTQQPVGFWQYCGEWETCANETIWNPCD